MGGSFVIVPKPGYEADNPLLFQKGLRILADIKRVSPKEQVQCDWVSAASFARQNGSGGAFVRDGRTGTFLLSTGTWFHDDGFGPGEELRLLREYGEVGSLRLAAKLQGFFVIVVAEPRTREVLVITDIVGSCHCYVRNLPSIIALSTSPIALAVLDHCSLDHIACQEFLQTGIMYEDRTFYREVRKLTPATVHRFSASGQSARQYWNVKNLEPESLADDVAVRSLWESLMLSARAVARSFPRPVCDLTGGYDSRSLVAAFTKSEVPFATTVSGPADSRDVLVASQVSEAAGLHLLHLTSEPARTMAEVEEAFRFTDGEYDVVEYARILSLHKRLAEEFDISVNGSFGEVARGYWWELLVPFTGRRARLDSTKLARARYAMPAPPSLYAPELRISIPDHMAAVIERNNTGLTGFPNTFQMDHAYIYLRMQSWQGRIARSTNQLWPCLSPFMLRPILETMLQARAALRTRSLMIRTMLTRYQPIFAKIPLEHGYPAVPASWNNLHHFWPLLPHYGQKVVERIARKLGLEPAKIGVPAKHNLMDQADVRALLTPVQMKLAPYLDAAALSELLRSSQSVGAESIPQWRYLLTLEYTLRAVAAATSRRTATTPGVGLPTN